MIKSAFACHKLMTEQLANHHVHCFSLCIESGIFATEWKMANLVPVYKQDDKQNAKNYQPVSLLRIFGKIFERLIYNIMYTCFIENDLISSKSIRF